MDEAAASAAKYVTAHIDEIPSIPYEWAPETEWKPLRRYFGIGSFGTNLFRAPASGAVLTEDHTEDPDSGTRHEELYLVVKGAPRSRSMVRSSTRRPARSCTSRIPRALAGAVARDAGTVLMAVGASQAARSRRPSGTPSPCPHSSRPAVDQYGRATTKE